MQATSTLKTNHTKTVTRYEYFTSTPGPVVELLAYEDKFCGVDRVAHNGNAPRFQELQLQIPYYFDYGGYQFQDTSNCAKTDSNPLSFSWDIISVVNISGDCNLQFFKSTDCDDSDGGHIQLDATNGDDECHNLEGIRSVQLVCGFF